MGWSESHLWLKCHSTPSTNIQWVFNFLRFFFLCSKRKNSVLETFWQWKTFLLIFFLIPGKLPLKNVHTSTILLYKGLYLSGWHLVLPELQQMGLKIKAVAEALYGVQHYRVLYAVHCTDTTHTQVWLLAFCQLFSHAWIPVFAKRFLCSRRTSGFFIIWHCEFFFLVLDPSWKLWHIRPNFLY